MRQRMEDELAQADGDIKVGPGGIVDAEFTAQFLALCHGGDHASLRATSTISTLRAAADADIADADAIDVLIEGYTRLRFLEHRMRIVHDRSVAALPDSGIELDKLARRAGYARSDALTEAVEKWTDLIRDAFRQVVKSV